MDNGAGYLFTMEIVKTPLSATGGGAAVIWVAGTVAVAAFVPSAASLDSKLVGVCDGIWTGPEAGGTVDVVSGATWYFSTGAPSSMGAAAAACAFAGGGNGVASGIGLTVDGVYGISTPSDT